MGEADEEVSVQGESELTKLRQQPKEWFFLTGNRLVVASGILLFLLAVALVPWSIGLIPLRTAGSMYYVFGGLIGGNLTLISLVVSIDQLVLSQQLGSPGDFRERIRNVDEYRSEIVEETESGVAPVAPTNFAMVMLEDARREVRSFWELVADADDEELRENASAFTDEVIEHVDTATDLLERSGVGTFSALNAILTTNYGTRIYDAQQLRRVYGDNLPDDAYDMLETIIDRLKLIDVGRQYFKTLYMQGELAYLSRALLYIGLITELILGLTLLSLTTGGESGFTPAFPNVVILIVFTIGLSPLVVLFTYIVRIALISQRTAAITPFTTPEQEPGLSLNYLTGGSSLSSSEEGSVVADED